MHLNGACSEIRRSINLLGAQVARKIARVPVRRATLALFIIARMNLHESTLRRQSDEDTAILDGAASRQDTPRCAKSGGGYGQ